MTDIALKLKEIISENGDIDISEVIEDAHIITDMGVDSLDFLDIAYEVSSELGVTIPLDDWMDEAAEGNLEPNYFVFKHLADYISANQPG